MILGTYINPPYKSYRSPEQSPSVSPPPAAVQDPVSLGSSPKRKRIEDHHAETGLRIEFGRGGSYADDEGSERSSPRTKVAAKLKGLEIEKKGNGKGERNSLTPRKRVKRSQGGGEEVETPLQLRGRLEIPESVGIGSEIGETPSMMDVERETPPSSPPISPKPDLQALRKSFGMSNSGQKNSASSNPTKRLPSPPPPTPRAPPPLSSSQQQSTSSPSSSTITSPFKPSLSKMEEPLTSLSSSLTWQDNEITGQELDPSPDDDGEGINGVGFRPTAQMAWVRSQKRKAQVEGWKTREAREARAKRSERRRKGRRGDVGKGKGRRVVRFEGE